MNGQSAAAYVKTAGRLKTVKGRYYKAVGRNRRFLPPENAAGWAVLQQAV
ncbi:hypothetical protein [Neisseria elongata]|jgi:hypothetical protein|uniref:Uncharacterized protein n=1 Tax=Neisseria elongata subsp. glycolytica ATCC 29315 TaxID=546263 RepID=D4DP57_NEIEG|nr:hypothetical protein [Neisseria elongata]EFE50346.1 hypothetical protein NEIELOOT_00843 [Neisseria elongata subsp. glycolytica ATCC 29315]